MEIKHFEVAKNLSYDNVLEYEGPERELTLTDYNDQFGKVDLEPVVEEELKWILRAVSAAFQEEADASKAIAEMLSRFGPDATLAKVAEGTRLVADDTEDGESDQ